MPHFSESLTPDIYCNRIMRQMPETRVIMHIPREGVVPLLASTRLFIL